MMAKRIIDPAPKMQDKDGWIAYLEKDTEKADAPELMIVQFSHVGRGKKCWMDRVSVPSFEALEHCVKKSGALMSRDIDFDEDPDGMSGRIFAGMRCVGEYKLVPDVATTP